MARGNPSEDEHAAHGEAMLRQADAALKKARKTTDRAKRADSLMVALRDSAVAHFEAGHANYDAVIDASMRTAFEARAEMFQMLGLPIPPLAVSEPEGNPRRARSKKKNPSRADILRRAMRGT